MEKFRHRGMLQHWWKRTGRGLSEYEAAIDFRNYFDTPTHAVQINLMNPIMTVIVLMFPRKHQKFDLLPSFERVVRE